MGACRCVIMPLDLCCDVWSKHQIWNLFSAVTGALLIRKLGRRTLFLVSGAGMLMCQYFPSFTMMEG
jgi:hypothetical protein